MKSKLEKIRRNKLTKNKSIKILFIIASIIFAMPSILYLIEKKTIFQFGPYFQFLYDNANLVVYFYISYIIDVICISHKKEKRDIFEY